MTQTLVASSHYTGLVLAVHPTTHGLGWVLFENPLKPVAWSIIGSRGQKMPALIAKFRDLLERYEPAVLVLEAFEGGENRREARIQLLCRAMIHEAQACDLKPRIFERETVRTAFARYGAVTRSEIARVIADRVDDFGHRLPPSRKPWSSIDARQSLFDAAALAITYFVAMGETDWPA